MRQIKTEIVTENNLNKLKILNEKIFPILSMTEMNENFYKIFTTSQGFALIATIDEKQAGAICCQMVANNSLYIRFIGTLSRFRRKGVGASLMAKVLREATARNVRSVYAYVRKDNKAAIFLNRKFGLVNKGECKQDETLVVMEKVFPRSQNQHP